MLASVIVPVRYTVMVQDWNDRMTGVLADDVVVLTVMVRFPGESHELSRSGTPSRRVQNQQHIRRWFDHWLMDRPAPEYGV